MRKKPRYYYITDLRGTRYAGTTEHVRRFSNDHPACEYPTKELAEQMARWLSQNVRPSKVAAQY